LVLLSLLCERDWHGYELNAELERREVSDWAPVSRPQVYYSLRKLCELGWTTVQNLTASSVTASSVSGKAFGPERQVYRITPLGRALLETALEREEWATGRVVPPFLTWLALSPFAPRATQKQMILRREAFVQAQLEREQGHLAAIRADTGAMVQVAEQMVTLTLRQYQTELEWLAELKLNLLASLE